MRKLLSLSLLLALALSACARPSDAPAGAPTAELQSPAPAVGETAVEFTYERIRCDGWSVEEPALLFSDAETLEAFVAELAPEEGWPPELGERLSSYGADFFGGNTLALAFFNETSGSVGHTLDSVSAENGVLTLHVTRSVPEIGTMDMASFALVAELLGDCGAYSAEVSATDAE